MMQRRYFFARALGNPDSVLQRIKTVVLRSGQAAQVPIVKLERKARGQFYVFLGVDCDQSYRIPRPLPENLRAIGLRFEEGHSLQPNDIVNMVQGGIDIHVFDSLQKRTWANDDPGDPFDRSEAWQAQEDSSESCGRFERMLGWLSARGEGNWEAFRKAGTILGLSERRQDARSALRRLCQLGHIDLSGDGSGWSISPAAFVRFADDPSNGFLVGQRTNTLLVRVRERVSLSETRQLYSAAPARIDLDSALLRETDDIAAFGIADAGAASTRLAELLPALDGWKNSLHPVSNLNTGSYIIEKWQAGGFQACDSVYDYDGVYYGESGMYRFRREGSDRTMTLFFDEPAQLWLRGDWYGLRFLALEAERHHGVEAVYDSNVGELLVPAAQRWPLLYERSLTLASGLLPTPAINPNWLSYTRIPNDLARTLSGKLNVALREE